MTNICNQSVGPTEQKVKFFTYYGCRGNQMGLLPGNYPDLNNLPIKGNDIDAMVIPPNMSVQGWSHPNFQGRQGTWGPGIHSDLNSPNRGIGNNDIDYFDDVVESTSVSDGLIDNTL